MPPERTLFFFGRSQASAVVEGLTKGLHDRSAITAVVVTEQGNECTGGLLCVIVWDCVKEMVHDVSVANVMENVVEQAVVAIDGAESALDPVPLAAVVVRNGIVGVLEQGDEHQPEVHPEVGKAVAEDDGGNGGIVRPDAEQTEHDNQSGVAEQDERALLLGEDGGVGVEVVGARLAVVTTSDVEEQVGGPAEGESDDHGTDATKGGAQEEAIGEEIEITKIAGLEWVEDLIALRVIGVRVVLTVADSPRVVGDKESRMEDESDRVVDGVVG